MKGKPGSSKYFIVTAVFFEDAEEALKCEDAISRARADLRLHENFEFHFNKCSRAIRERFLQAVSGRKFFYHAMVMNKTMLWSNRFLESGEFYRFTAGIVFENAESRMDNATVVIDKCGDRVFKNELIRHLKTAANKNGNRIKRVKMQESHANNLLQLADMVCGAVAKSLNDPGPKGWHYRRIIRSKEARVQLWPKGF